MSMTMARLAVERGARDVLDRFFTSERDGVREDWEYYVDLDKLDMWDLSRCIIGQMAPLITEPERKHEADYNTALEALDNSLGINVSGDGENDYEEWSENHGFESSADFTFIELNQAWTDEIRSRLDKIQEGLDDA